MTKDEPLIYDEEYGPFRLELNPNRMGCIKVCSLQIQHEKLEEV
jgi:hypothetical protein